MINPLHLSDEGNYIVKVNVRGNGTIAASQKIQVAVDGKSVKYSTFVLKKKIAMVLKYWFLISSYNNV